MERPPPSSRYTLEWPHSLPLSLLVTLTMATLSMDLHPRIYPRVHSRQHKVIVAIASGASPTLSDATPASAAFRAFLAAALVTPSPV